MYIITFNAAVIYRFCQFLPYSIFFWMSCNLLMFSTDDKWDYSLQLVVKNYRNNVFNFMNIIYSDCIPSLDTHDERNMRHSIVKSSYVRN